MIAERTFNTEMILAVLLRPDIFATIAEDDFYPKEAYVDTKKDCWLAMIEGDLMVGVYHLHSLNGITLKAHAHVLPEYRKEFSRATGEAMHQYIYDNILECEKVVVEIPVIYENVRQFVFDIHFQQEGVNRLSYRKGGKIIDQWVLGITRAEIGAFLNG